MEKPVKMDDDWGYPHFRKCLDDVKTMRLYESVWDGGLQNLRENFMSCSMCMMFEVKPTIFADARSWNAVGCPEVFIQQGFLDFGYAVNLWISWTIGYGIMMPLSYITWRTRQNFLVDPMIRDRSWISHGMEDSQQMSTIHTWIIHQHTVYFRIPYTDTQDTTISTCILCIYHMSRLSIPWLENPLLATVDGDPKSTFQAFGSKASDWLAFS